MQGRTQNFFFGGGGAKGTTAAIFTVIHQSLVFFVFFNIARESSTSLMCNGERGTSKLVLFRQEKKLDMGGRGERAKF